MSSAELYCHSVFCTLIIKMWTLYEVDNFADSFHQDFYLEEQNSDHCRWDLYCHILVELVQQVHGDACLSILESKWGIQNWYFQGLEKSDADAEQFADLQSFLNWLSSHYIYKISRGKDSGVDYVGVFGANIAACIKRRHISIPPYPLPTSLNSCSLCYFNCLFAQAVWGNE
jgi:hypothetical protein